MNDHENSSKAFRTYASLTRVLHQLILTGRGDSDEADNIRDRMDGPWKAMTTEERERSRLIAAPDPKGSSENTPQPNPCGYDQLTDHERHFVDEAIGDLAQRVMELEAMGKDPPPLEGLLGRQNDPHGKEGRRAFQNVFAQWIIESRIP